MRTLKAYTLLLLSVFILSGSIAEVHAHHSDINLKSAEVEKEVEDSSKKERVFESDMNHPMLLFVLIQGELTHFEAATVTILESITDTPHLLSSHRIALPPPV